jgi:hypothetical protein
MIFPIDYRQGDGSFGESFSFIKHKKAGTH